MTDLKREKCSKQGAGMKAVFLDYQSLDKNDLDFRALAAQFDQWTVYPSNFTA